MTYNIKITIFAQQLTKLYPMPQQNIKRIVLTGGPCAGKTTATDEAIRHFTELGYKVFSIPEIPTMFTKAGMNYLTKNKDFFYEGEKATLEIQLALEDKFSSLAQTISRPVIILYDRGTLDISAYMAPDMWNEITTLLGTSTEELINRYDAIIHLRSTASGAEQYYTTSNNAQRLEQADVAGLQIARELDQKVLDAWKSHPHTFVIGNYPDFREKANAVLEAIHAIL